MLTVVVDSSNIDNDIITISEKSDYNHVKNVFRLGAGDNLRVVDGNYEYITEINEINKKNIILNILQKNDDKYSLCRRIDVAIGLLKNENMNLVIKKLTEIGVNEIIPLKTERVVVKLSEKKEKWDMIVKEAMKQCRSVKYTKISELTDIKNINFLDYDKIIYAYENSHESKKIHEIIKKEDKKILYIIGPEGGITNFEREFLKMNGAIEVSLGNRILRAETAAIVLGGILANI